MALLAVSEGRSTESTKIAFGGDFAVPCGVDPARIRRAVEDLQGLVDGFPLVLNMESAIYRPSRHRGMADGICSDMALVFDTFRKLNVCAVSVANNHTYDSGEEQFIRLVNTLRGKLNITVTGVADQRGKPSSAGRLVLPRGSSVSLIGAAWNGTASRGRRVSRFWYPTQLYGQIEAERRVSDFVIVLVHWGYEFERFPMPVQRHWSHKFIDLGADVVIGSHPHVIQGIEVYRGKLIAYSLGNFLFPRTTVTAYHPESAANGLVLKLELLPDRTYKHQFVGIHGTHLGSQVGVFCADELLDQLSEPLSMPIDEYTRWYGSSRSKWYLPCFDGTPVDLFRIVMWAGVRGGVSLSARLGIKDFVRRVVSRAR